MMIVALNKKFLKRTVLLCGVSACTLFIGGHSAGYSMDHAAHLKNYQSSSYLLKASEEDNEQKLKGAENFIENMVKRAISFLSKESLSVSEQKAEFKSLLNDSFDIKTIARFSLGRYWRVSSKSEKREYLDLFEKMIIDVYSKRFGDYQGQSVNIASSRLDGKSDIIVTTYFTGSNHPDVQVDWRVRYKKAQYKVVDIIVEGVSMSLTQRSDFASVIQRGGGRVEVLLAHLR